MRRHRTQQKPSKDSYSPDASQIGDPPSVSHSKLRRRWADLIRRVYCADPLILDAGADYGHYKVDFSSSFPTNGRFSSRQRQLYELANAVRNICLKMYRPGITFKDVGKKVEAFLVEQGIDLSDPSNRNFRGIIRWGGYNHPVGMAVHDVMGSMSGPEEVLQPGFVFACDIQIPKPKEKMGIRLEDTVVITEDGCEVLSYKIPRTIEEIEGLMKEDGMIQILRKANRY